MIAVDTNIVCFYWLPSPRSSEAEALAELEPAWLVPPLWRSEFRNALASSVRHGVVAMKDAMELVARAENRLRSHERQVSSQTVMELVARSSCTAYDCEFVAVAREQGVPLITADREILREFPHLSVSLGNFLSS
ncbi:hypothetical protein BH20VER3_BH20VER3_01460 [soil metagenome]